MRAYDGEVTEQSNAAGVGAAEAELANQSLQVDVAADVRDAGDQPDDQHRLLEPAVIVAGLAAIDAHHAVALHQRVLGVPQAGHQRHGGEADVEPDDDQGECHPRRPPVEAAMRAALQRVAIDEAERQRLVGERDQEDHAHDRLHRGEVRLGGVHDQRDRQPAPPERDVGDGTVNPQPPRRLPLPRRYQHGTKQ